MHWQPSATFNVLHERAAIMAKVRQFFTKRHYLEVETPVMSQFGITDVYLNNIQAQFRGQNYYLQTSPEYHMKRLLAAGSGPIFQLARVFRDDELGRWHNPEFTLLEWYQLDIDHHELMNEVEELLRLILNCPPLIKKTYVQIFNEICSEDPFTASLEQLRQLLGRFQLDNVLDPQEKDRDQYLFLLMSHVIEPALAEIGSPVAVYDFPSSQASLAQVKAGVAQRFEIYYQGVELANGFHELTDANAQQMRFEEDLMLRKRENLPLPRVDHWLIEALTHGLPPCSGVALGIDRLVALALKKTELAHVLAFDFSKA